MSEIINNIPFKIDRNKLKKDLMINNQKDEKALIQMITAAEEIAKPGAIYREVSITKKNEDYLLIDDIKLESKILSENILENKGIFIYVITIGKEIADWPGEDLDLLQSYWVDQIKNSILNLASTYVYEKMDKLFGRAESCEMTPGSLPDWALQEQRKLFRLLGNVESAIGVTLTDSFLMVPVKSISGIKFTTKSKTSCKLCQRKDCPTRKAAYDRKFINNYL